MGRRSRFAKYGNKGISDTFRDMNENRISYIESATQAQGLDRERVAARIDALLASLGPESRKYWEFWRARVLSGRAAAYVADTFVTKLERVIAIKRDKEQPTDDDGGFIFADWLAKYLEREKAFHAKRPDWMNDPSKLPKKPPSVKKDEDE